jgi:D-alanyl-D-alanine carboxypeptidase (penicillin-binding protein 5/6)
LVTGDGRPAASPHQQPAPIASLAKVMTAYLTLERYPLSGAQDGFTTTITAAQAQAVAQDRAEGQSVVAVAAGEPLTERRLLEALLIPSGNNIAEMLAAQVAGSETRFVAEMNAEARALGMDHTIDTDPSGFAPSTISTAADQLRVFGEGDALPRLPPDRLDGQRDAAGRRCAHQFQPADRRGVRRQDRVRLRGRGVPGVLHPDHYPRENT